MKYRHYKGGLYNLLCFAKLEKTGEEVAVYESVNGGIPWVRPLTEWNEKFRQED